MTAGRHRVGGGAGGLLFFVASLSVGLAAFVVLAVLAHSASPGGLADASAVLGVSFVTAVIPGAIQLRAAATAAQGGAVAGVPALLVTVLSGAMLVGSPAVAYALTVPVLSIILLAVQLVIACHVAVQRGVAIGRGHHARASISLAVDAAVRLVIGVLLGALLGSVGLALALAAGTGAAAVAGRGWYAVAQRGSGCAVVAPALTVGVLMLLVNLDVLVAPRVLGPGAADAYAVAELPAKGIFFVLFAVSWLAVPHAVRSARRAELLTPVAAVLAAGVLATATLLVARPLLPVLLGGTAPVASLLVVLGMAMTAAAGLATALSMALARGAARPWAASLMAGMALIALVLWLRPDGDALALLILTAQSAALFVTVGVLLRTLRQGSDVLHRSSAPPSRSVAEGAAGSTA